MTSNHIQFPVRLPRKLRAALEESAKRAGTSLNGEVIRQLEQAFNEATSGSRICRLAGICMDVAGRVALRAINDAADPKDWADHPAAWAQAVDAALYVISEFRPDGAPALSGADRHSAGAALTAMLIEDVPGTTAMAVQELGQLSARLQRSKN
jgi:Arc-like DNA binding domain